MPQTLSGFGLRRLGPQDGARVPIQRGRVTIALEDAAGRQPSADQEVGPH